MKIRGIEWDGLPRAATPCFRSGSLPARWTVRGVLVLADGPHDGGNRPTAEPPIPCSGLVHLHITWGKGRSNAPFYPATAPAVPEHHASDRRGPCRASPPAEIRHARCYNRPLWLTNLLSKAAAEPVAYRLIRSRTNLSRLSRPALPTPALVGARGASKPCKSPSVEPRQQADLHDRPERLSSMSGCLIGNDHRWL